MKDDRGVVASFYNHEFELSLGKTDMVIEQSEFKHRLVAISVLITVFAISRWCYYLAGLRFDHHMVDIQWHLLDTYWLRIDLLRSLYYLHSQPPLFNLLVGMVLKWFPGHVTVAFASLYFMFGLAITLSLYGLFTRLGVPLIPSVIIVCLFVVSPPVVLYENWCFYTYPVTACLCLMGFFLHRFIQERRTWDGIALFSLLLALVLLRPVFHVLWMVVIAVFVGLAVKKDWKKVVVCGCIPIALALAWYGKNFLLFGTISTSSWLGMNLARQIIPQFSEEEKRGLIDKKIISSITLIYPFSPVSKYKSIVADQQATGIPVLDDEHKRSGITNYNHRAYISIAQQYWNDSLTLIGLKPYEYLRCLKRAVGWFFFPASDYQFLHKNRLRVQKLEAAFNTFVLGQKLIYVDGANTYNYHYDHNRIAWFLVVGYLTAVLYGFYILAKALVKRSCDKPFFVTIAVIWSTVVYLSIAYVGIDRTENHRMRFTIDPFILLMLSIFITHCVSALKRLIRNRSNHISTIL
jgi:hypothetical protein